MARKRTVQAGERTQKKGKPGGLQNKKVTELRSMVRRERNAGKHPGLTGAEVSLLNKAQCLDLLERKGKPGKKRATVGQVAENAPIAYRRRTVVDVILSWADGFDRLKNPWNGTGKLVLASGVWMELQTHRVSQATRMVPISGQGWFGVEPILPVEKPDIEVMEMPQGDPPREMDLETGGGFGAMLTGR